MRCAAGVRTTNSGAVKAFLQCGSPRPPRPPRSRLLRYVECDWTAFIAFGVCRMLQRESQFPASDGRLRDLQRSTATSLERRQSHARRRRRDRDKAVSFARPDSHVVEHRLERGHIENSQPREVEMCVTDPRRESGQRLGRPRGTGTRERATKKEGRGPRGSGGDDELQ